MERIIVKTTYGNICVYKKGNGPKPVVLLHGSGCDSAMLSWREVMEAFGDEYTLYAPDLLGYGRSDKPQNMCGKHFYKKHIRSVKEIVDYFRLEQFVLAGLSMGGAIAIGFALKYPKRVKLLVPVASWGISEKLPMHHFSYWYIHYTDFTLKQYGLIEGRRWMAKWLISYALIGDKRNITEALVDEVLEACKGNHAGKSMLDFQRSSSTKDGSVPYYVNELGKMEMPIVFVNGDKDPLVPLKHVLAAARRTRTNKCYELKGCKHWSVKERPDEFVKIICEHVDEKNID